MQVLLDTNFLMLPAQKADIYSMLESRELVTLDACVAELKKLAAGNGKAAAYAKVALELAKKLKVAESKGNTDRAIISYALAKKCAVATNDRDLIKSLKSHGVKIIRLRQGKYLVEE